MTDFKFLGHNSERILECIIKFLNLFTRRLKFLEFFLLEHFRH